MYDLLILGSGPAGLSAAIYAARAELDFAVVESSYVSGGQITSTYEIDNYPGLNGISGQDLADRMRKHADSLGAKFLTAEATGISGSAGNFTVETSSGPLSAKTVIIATGAEHAELGVPGEQELRGKGVSYCATCDGMFFKDKDIAVVGGGDTAVSDAIYLTRMCRSVTLIHRRDSLRAAKSLQDRFISNPRASVEWSSTVQKIEGNGKVEDVILRSTISGEEKPLEVSGVFIAVGIIPRSAPFAGFVEVDKRGYITASEDCAASVPGVFAAGDVRAKQLRQIITAAADGANAVTGAQKILASL